MLLLVLGPAFIEPLAVEVSTEASGARHISEKLEICLCEILLKKEPLSIPACQKSKIAAIVGLEVVVGEDHGGAGVGASVLGWQACCKSPLTR